MKKTFLLFLLLSAPCALARIMNITNDADFTKISNGKRPTIFKFASNWCGVCKAVEKPFEEVSNEKEFKNVLFAHVDTDKLQHASKKQGIVGVPTFIYIRGGSKKDQVIGVENMQTFKDDLRKHIRKSLVAQNEVAAPKEKAMSLEEIAKATPEELSPEAPETPAMEPGMPEDAEGISAPAMPVAEAGIMAKIKGFFFAIFVKFKDLLIWIKDGIMTLFDKIAFWRK